jgi:putative SOS response-associated peptidase YedK
MQSLRVIVEEPLNNLISTIPNTSPQDTGNGKMLHPLQQAWWAQKEGERAQSTPIPSERAALVSQNFSTWRGTVFQSIILLASTFHKKRHHHVISTPCSSLSLLAGIVRSRKRKGQEWSHCCTTITCH